MASEVVAAPPTGASNLYPEVSRYYLQITRACIYSTAVGLFYAIPSNISPLSSFTSFKRSGRFFIHSRFA